MSESLSDVQARFKEKNEKSYPTWWLIKNIPENQEWFKLIEKSSITEDLYDELREGKTIQNENYTTYMMRLFLNAHIPLYKDLWFEEYNLLYT
ncbi:Hypothetical protein CINCED_3A017858 [Cinara cedri]|uniref:Uncharacterized protein n=1 Tax=Cinara cedri TaxID=506608 RepID=A0A5E4NIX3_9HEMI|nr:Hypothetical protein CINCED_3A017858 [Cinara cedri]